MTYAVTFDLWDTIIHDDSDEVKRKKQGLRTKREERRYLLWEALNRQQRISRNSVWLACDNADAAFNRSWRQRSVTWTVRERLAVVLDELGRTLPEGVLALVVRDYEEMEIKITPDIIEGAADSVRDLTKDFRLAVVSDAIVSPGRCLRQWLDLHEIYNCFQSFAFSDEVGHSKPHPDMFLKVSGDLDVPIEDMIHVGDREHNDIQGPQALGMKAVLFSGTRDKDRKNTTADAICDHHRDLPNIVRQLANP
jgi:putative hydrolase of the HAD superfamily